MKRTTLSERGLVLAPRGRDAAIAANMLTEAGYGAMACVSLGQLIGELDKGAAFVVVTEEAFASTDLHALAGWIGEQEEWSDLPFILLTVRGGGLERNPAAGRLLQLLGNVTFLERPFHPTTLVSLAQSAVRGRRRQYEARARLEVLRVLNDTLERRVSEAVAEKNLFADIVEGTDALVQVVDPDFRWLAVNKASADAYERIYGVRPKAGDRMLDVFAHLPQQRSEMEAAWGRALAGEEFTEIAELGDPAQERRAYEMKYNALRRASGRRVGAYQFAYDVTERIREQRKLAAAEEQLRQSQKMEAVGQLTGGVAHDFNNLLTPITGVLDMVGRRYGDDPRTARLVEGALQSAERAKTLVQRLLGFARRQALETRPIDLGDLIRGMRDLIASSVGPAVELRIMNPGELPAALVDPNQLELAILNLCVNARHAMPVGGVMTIAVELKIVGPAGLSTLEPGGYLRLSVIDTGVGMDAETLAKAVEPFYSTKGVGKGTGLGLSMVHGLAAQLGGAFVLTSELGKGTRADLYLPIAEGPAVAQRHGTGDARPGGRRLSILLVDDEPLVRSGVAEMLRELGHAVVEAGSGPEALATLTAGEGVEVLVTDYMMPRMNGAELARRAREVRPDLGVLVITGYAGGDVELGFPKVAKPFRQADLAAALSDLDPDDNVVRLPHRR